MDINHNKVLKLVNVLSRRIDGLEPKFQDKQILMLQNYIKSKQLESIGPLIYYSSNVKGVDTAGKPITTSKFMQQLSSSDVKVDFPYKFKPSMQIEKTLHLRFEDKVNKAQFASMKMLSYAYENEIELTGETYTVFLKQDEPGYMTADIFMPIK